MNMRIEKDSMGEIEVPSSAYWGAQTQRSLANFPKDVETMPKELIYAIVNIKKAAAIVNNSEDKLSEEKKDLIVAASNKILLGHFDDQFPLSIWQTGSGTQTNMNVNEVIAHIANEKAGKNIIHPNDDVNMSQSSNDVFPTAMHIAAYMAIKNHLLPELDKTIETLKELEEKYDIIKTGRTHLQDATPITLTQEISAFRSALERDSSNIDQTSKKLRKLAIGGTAVGTGLNASPNFGEHMAKVLSNELDESFSSDENKFFQLSLKSGLVNSHGTIKALATNLYKIASDIRFLSCGPRSGIGELNIPANEPGSSIMPGKVNPTQIESMTMICIQVMANDMAISMANTQGQLQLNAYMPLIIYNFNQSVTLLAKGLACFRENLLIGLSPNEAIIKENLENSLMLVTSLSPHIGYDKASEIAKFAFENDIKLREASIKLGYLTEEEFDKYVRAENMV